MTTEQRTLARIQIGAETCADSAGNGTLAIVTGGKHGDDFVLLAVGGSIHPDFDELGFETFSEAWETALSIAKDLVAEEFGS
jgi:hypothetical protein